MKHRKLVSILIALMMLFGSIVSTTALAATTVPADTTVVAEQTTEAEAEKAEPSFGQQIRKILIFGAIVGVIAVGYGLTTMRYNAEKMDDMTQESRKIVERMRDDNE